MNIAQDEANLVADECVNRLCPLEDGISRKPDFLKFQNNELKYMDSDNFKALSSEKASSEKLFPADRAKVCSEDGPETDQNYDGCEVGGAVEIDQAEEAYEQERGEAAPEKIMDVPVCELTNSCLHSGEKRNSYSDCTLPGSYLVNRILQSNNNNKNCLTRPAGTEESFQTNPEAQKVGHSELRDIRSHSEYFLLYNEMPIKHATEAEFSKQCPNVDFDKGCADVLPSSTCTDKTDAPVQVTHKISPPSPAKCTSVQDPLEADFHCAVTTHPLSTSCDITSVTINDDSFTRDNDNINRVEPRKNENPLLHAKDGKEVGFYSQSPTECTGEMVFVEKDNVREGMEYSMVSQPAHDLQKGIINIEKEPGISENCALIGNMTCCEAGKPNLFTKRGHENASSDSNREPHLPPSNTEVLDAHAAMPQPSPHKQENISEMALRQCEVVPRDRPMSMHNIPLIEDAEKFSETINCKYQPPKCSASPQAETDREGNDGRPHVREGLCPQKKNKTVNPAHDCLPEDNVTFTTSQNLPSSFDTLNLGSETIESSLSARKAMESKSIDGILSTGSRNAGSLPLENCGEEHSEHSDSENKTCREEDVALPPKVTVKTNEITSRIINTLGNHGELNTDENGQTYHLGQLDSHEVVVLLPKNIPTQDELANEHCTGTGIEYPLDIPERTLTTEAQKQITTITSVKGLTGGSLVEMPVNDNVNPSDISTGMKGSSRSTCKSLADKRPVPGTNNIREDICGNRCNNTNKTAADATFKVEDFKCRVLEHAAHGDEDTVGQSLYESVKENKDTVGQSLYESVKDNSTDKENTLLVQSHQETDESLKMHKKSTLRKNDVLFNKHLIENAGTATENNETKESMPVPFSVSHDQPPVHRRSDGIVDINDQVFKTTRVESPEETASPLDLTDLVASNKPWVLQLETTSHLQAAVCDAAGPTNQDTSLCEAVAEGRMLACSETAVEEEALVTPSPTAGKKGLCEKNISSLQSEESFKNINQGIVLNAEDCPDLAHSDVRQQHVQCDFLLMAKAEESTCEQPANGKQKMMPANQITEKSLEDANVAAAAKTTSDHKRDSLSNNAHCLQDTIPVQEVVIDFQRVQTSAKVGIKYPTTEHIMSELSKKGGGVFDQVGHPHICGCVRSKADGSNFTPNDLQENILQPDTKESAPGGKEFLRSCHAIPGICEHPVNQAYILTTSENDQVETSTWAKLQSKSKLDSSNIHDCLQPSAKQITGNSSRCYQAEEGKHLLGQFNGDDEMVVRAGLGDGHTKRTFEEHQVQPSPLTDHVSNAPTNALSTNVVRSCEQDDPRQNTGCLSGATKTTSLVSQTVSLVNNANMCDTPHDHNRMSQIIETLNAVQCPPPHQSPVESPSSVAPGTQKGDFEVADSASELCSHLSNAGLATSSDCRIVNTTCQRDDLCSEHIDPFLDQIIPKQNLCSGDLDSVQIAMVSLNSGTSNNYVPPLTAASAQVANVGSNRRIFAEDNRLLTKHSFTPGNILLSRGIDTNENDLTSQELFSVYNNDRLGVLDFMKEEGKLSAGPHPPTKAHSNVEQNNVAQKSRETVSANGRSLMSLESIVRSGKLPSVLFSEKVILDERAEQQKPLIIRRYADNVVQVYTGSPTNAHSEIVNFPSVHLAKPCLDCGTNYGVQKVQRFSKESELSDCDCKKSSLTTSTYPSLKPENQDDIEGKDKNKRMARQSEGGAVGKTFCKGYSGLVSNEAGHKTGNDDHKVAKDIEKKNILKSERLKSSSVSKKHISGLSESSSVCSQNEVNMVPFSGKKLLLDAVPCTKGEREARQQNHTLSDPSIVLTSNSEHIANAFFRSLQDLNMSVEPPSPTDEGLPHFEITSEIKPSDFAQDQLLPCHQQKATQTQNFPLAGEMYSQTCFGDSLIHQSPEFTHDFEATAILDDNAHQTDVHLNVLEGETYQKTGGVVKKPKNQQVEALSCLHDNKDVMHFGSSDINPYTHPWQQEEPCRIGWKQYVFGSASDVSSQPVPQGLDALKVMRCSSVDNGLNAQHSPFHSHLSSYVNARAISSTLSSIEDSQGWDDESQDFEPTYSSEGVKHYYPLPSEVIITKPEDGVSHFESPSRTSGNNSGQVDEIVLLYPSESESSEKTEKTMCEQGTQTANKTRSRRLGRRQQSYVDVSKAKSEQGRRSVPRPASLASMQDLSFHLSQLLHDTSEILGNLTQQRLVDGHLTDDGSQRVFSETKVRRYLADNSTQTTLDQGIQTDFPLVSETADQDNQAETKHDYVNAKKGSSGQILVKLERAPESDQGQNGNLPIDNEKMPQNGNYLIQSMPNLSHDAATKGSHESLITQTSCLRSSTPFLEDFTPTLSNSQPGNVVFSPVASPVPSVSPFPKPDGSPNCSVASSAPYLLGDQLEVKRADGKSEKKQAYQKALLVDRASSPIMTLDASPNTSSSSHSVSDSLKPSKDVLKSYTNKKKQVLHSTGSCSVTDSSMDSSSQTETDSPTSSSQGGKKAVIKSALPCRKLDKRRLEENIPCEPKLKHRVHCENNGKKEVHGMQPTHADSGFGVKGHSEREIFDQHAEDNIPLQQSIPAKYATINELNVLSQAEQDFGSSDSLFVKQYPESVDRFRRMSSSFEDSLHSHENSKCSFGLQPSRSSINTLRKTTWEIKERLATIPPQVQNHSTWPNANSVPTSTARTSDMTVQLPDDDSASVAASECNTDVLLNENPTTFVYPRPRSYSLRDLPMHNKFSNWSGVQQNPLSPRSLASSTNDFLFEAPMKQVSQHDDEAQGKPQLSKSKAKEIEVLRRERAQVMSGIQLDMNPHHLTVELAEAKLSYGIGETDALLRVLQSGKGEALNSVSMKQKLYERHMKSIEALRKEREERLQSFRRSRSLSPQKHLSLSQGSLTSPRDLDLPSRRREYLQQLRKDVVDNTRIQEPKRKTGQCPSEIEVLLRDYQRAREEAKTEIARARDKLRERAEQEKRRLHQQMVSNLLKEESKMKTLLSTSTLCTGSSLSLSSGPTSGYNSCNTATYAASKYNMRDGQAFPRSVDDSKKNFRGRSSIRNSQLYVLDTSLNNSDPEGLSTSWESRGDQTPQSGGSSPRSTRGIELSFNASPPSPSTSYRDLAKHTLANATAEIMTACSYNLGNLFKCQATAGWKYQCTEQDIMVYYKAYPSASRHGFLGAGIIARPLQSVWSVVKDASKRHLYDKSLTTLQVHKRVSGDIQLVYLMSDMSQCYLNQPRDFCCVSVESKEEKWFTVAFQSVYDESMPRPSKDTVRGEILPSAWIMQPDTMNGKDITRVIYSVEVELGAPALPARVLSSIAKQQPLVIASLSNFLSG